MALAFTPPRSRPSGRAHPRSAGVPFLSFSPHLRAADVGPHGPLPSEYCARCELAPREARRARGPTPQTGSRSPSHSGCTTAPAAARGLAPDARGNAVRGAATRTPNTPHREPGGAPAPRDPWRGRPAAPAVGGEGPGARLQVGGDGLGQGRHRFRARDRQPGRDLCGRASAAGASGHELTVDLERCEIRDAAGPDAAICARPLPSRVPGAGPGRDRSRRTRTPSPRPRTPGGGRRPPRSARAEAPRGRG